MHCAKIKSKRRTINFSFVIVVLFPTKRSEKHDYSLEDGG